MIIFFEYSPGRNFLGSFLFNLRPEHYVAGAKEHYFQAKETWRATLGRLPPGTRSTYPASPEQADHSHPTGLRRTNLPGKTLKPARGKFGGLSLWNTLCTPERTCTELSLVVPASRRHAVLELETGQKRTAIPKDPELSSAVAPWRGILLERHSSLANEMPDILAIHHVVVLYLSQGEPRYLKLDGQDWKEYDFAPGTVSVVPAGSRFAFRAPETGDFVLVQIEPEFLQRAARELISGERLELTMQLGICDGYLAECIRTLLAEAEQHYLGGRAYGESVATAMATHIVRRYSRSGPSLKGTLGGLAPFQLRRVTDFIRQHLSQPISLQDLASVAGLSVFHFARMFKAATGTTPKQYVVRCKLERARELLLTEDRSITEIALEVGFCDQSHLSTHFKRLYGTTPKQFVREARR